MSSYVLAFCWLKKVYGGGKFLIDCFVRSEFGGESFSRVLILNYFLRIATIIGFSLALSRD